MKFSTYKEAYKFWFGHKDFTRPGVVLAMNNTPDGWSVYDRPIQEPEEPRRNRKGEKNTKSGCISDDLGLKGMVNHADGKRYDSKSEFRKATRRAGCYEIGNDIKTQDMKVKTPLERGIRGDYNVRPQLKQAIEKVIGT